MAHVEAIRTDGGDIRIKHVADGGKETELFLFITCTHEDLISALGILRLTKLIREEHLHRFTRNTFIQGELKIVEQIKDILRYISEETFKSHFREI